MTAPGPAGTPGRGRLWPWVTGALAAGIAGGVGYEVATWPEVAALARRNPEATAFIEQYRRRQRAAGGSDAVGWDWVADQRISPHLRRAVVAAEDMEFFAHHGFSSAELKDALTQALRKLEAPRGASTITQQLAKNLWLSPSRNPFRKLKEALLTRQLERHLTKRRILELYLNVVEFGPGIYGAEAAARHYFGKPASDLNEREAAELAASLPRPSTWHPGRASEAYARYVAEIERRMSVATFLWRAVGAEPVAEGAGIAVNLDSILVMLQDTLGPVAHDTILVPADSDSVALAPPGPDSAAAVTAALDALLAAIPEQSSLGLVVAGFTRDTAGVLVDLVPGVRPDTGSPRGGGVVRIWKDGTATIVRLHP
jgi:monofunctional biosynthetic peptidoglycan transglycosylase